MLDTLATVGKIPLPHRQVKPDFDTVRRIDLLPMATIEDMMTLGTAINVDYLKSLSKEFEDRMHTLEAKVLKRVPKDKLAEFLGNDGDDDDEDDYIDRAKPSYKPSSFKINSPEQIAWFLFETLGLGKDKKLITTPDGKRLSTGKKQLELLKNEHEVVQDILDYRQVHKLKSTYVDKFPRIARYHPRSKCCPQCGRPHKHATMRIHTTIVVTRTDTGRLAGRNPNLMNIPARSELGKKVRRAFTASPGKKLISTDYSQIELRVVASEAQDQFMMSCFRKGRDVHADSTLKAMNLYGKADYVKDVNNPKGDKILTPLVKGFTVPDLKDFIDMRAGMKNANFGIVYGITWQGLQAQLALPPINIYWTKEQCIDFIENTWHKVFPGIRPYMDIQEYRARLYNFVWDLWGSVRYMPGMRSKVNRVIAEAIRAAGNMPIQSGASAMLKILMYVIRKVYEVFRQEGYEVDPLLPIHDELLTECDEEIAYELKDMTIAKMEWVNELAQLDVPIKAEGKVMDVWEK